ncbi:hypothetical protein OXT66_05500 [Lentilactobacillus senioris]|uniref:hypothetical protein n=1 Tax=Lentilactobacillus senioris TaxID=931534 RepID=UPI0022823965|nr:hypothetical protein [Lentilactobacillus senioris]MCY9807005.1 hypothetical protein [Lentilactobacillus senioris]
MKKQMDNKTGYFNSDEFKRMQKQLDRVAKLTESNRKWLKQVNLAYNPVFNQVNTVNRTINSAIKTAGISQLDIKRNNEFYRNILKGIPHTNPSIALGTRNQLLNNYRFIQNSPSVSAIELAMKPLKDFNKRYGKTMTISQIAAQSAKSQNFWLKEIQKLALTNIKTSTQFNHVANEIGLTTNHPTEEQLQKRMEILPPEISQEIVEESENIVSNDITVQKEEIHNVVQNHSNQNDDNRIHHAIEIGKNKIKEIKIDYASFPEWQKPFFSGFFDYCSGALINLWIHNIGISFTVSFLSLLFVQNVTKIHSDSKKFVNNKSNDPWNNKF